MSVYLLVGGAGSLGSCLTKRLLKDGHVVRVYSRDERKHQLLRREVNNPNLRTMIGDVRDRGRLKRAMQGVDYVVHLAAMKHVDICETNPLECVNVNVLGSANVVECAVDSKVKGVLGISTDKASSPNNVYGASKLMMEDIFKEGHIYAGSHRIRFGTIRFANILDSVGNVFEIWAHNLSKGLRLPITSPDMVRPFITAQNAVEAIQEALEYMNDEAIWYPSVFVYRGALNYRIIELANVFSPDLELIGLRPGERLRDPMMAEWEVDQAIIVTSHLYLFNKDLKPDRDITTPTIKDELEKFSDSKELVKLYHSLQNHGSKCA